jgi:DNA sulfur modification protein DndD
LKPFLSLEFVKLLVFDGELAAQLLDSRHTNAQKAIDQMYQLTFFADMKDRISEYWKEEAQKIGSKGNGRELTRRSNRVTTLENRYNHVKKSYEEGKSKLKTIKETLEKLNSDSKQQLEKNKNDALLMQRAESGLESAQDALASSAKALAIMIKNPVEFSQKVAANIHALKESLDRARLPGIAAREFFDEIAEEPICICGREIDAAVKEAIKAGAKKFLGSEEMNVLNALKSDVRNKFPDGQVISGELVKQLVEEVKIAQDRENAASQNLDAIKHTAGDHNPEIEKIQRRITALTKAQGELEKEMEKYGELDDSDESWNLKILAKRKTDAIDVLANTTGTIDLKKKKDILCDILQSAFEKSRKLLSEQICEEANKKIKTLMPHNQIQIDMIDRSLRLVGKEGGSVGETLSVGYAFLSSLLSNTEQNLPSVVDSPSGAIDLQIRPEVARLIPRLADQFIAFTISSERQNFVDPLIATAGTDLNFVTLFRKGNTQLETTVRTIGKKKGNYKESTDGIWITGKEYFEQFHTETE